MSQISVSNLTFAYEGSFDNIFEDVSFTIDTDWKLGFVGRNGRGKTTFLKLLMNKYEYSGKILSNIDFEYFPFEITDKSKLGTDIVEEICSNYEFWKLCRELSLLEVNQEILFRPFKTLSNGEQTKILLAALFLKGNNFLLIDEPTNHLDLKGRELVAKYLNSKKGFILVSHDRTFLDSCIDHVISINRANIEIQQGNFSSWIKNKEYQDNFELFENEKLKKEIKHLEKSSRQTANWSDKVEKTKYGNRNSGLRPDRGYIGHKAAKMMKRSILAQNRKEKAIEDKSKLLKNIEKSENLKLYPLAYCQNKLAEILNLSIFYDENQICKNVSFAIENGDRIALIGKNGCGKSSILKLILGCAAARDNSRESFLKKESPLLANNLKQLNLRFIGTVNTASNLRTSYVSQQTGDICGSLSDFCKVYNIEETLFKTILRKMDFSRSQFSKNIGEFSAGQKKKVLIAKSLCEKAHLYIWDEPLNFVDVLSRIQIENLILEYKPTMIFVEHDKIFCEKVATKIIKF